MGGGRGTLKLNNWSSQEFLDMYFMDLTTMHMAADDKFIVDFENRRTLLR